VLAKVEKNKKMSVFSDGNAIYVVFVTSIEKTCCKMWLHFCCRVLI
jgi:hypothetical protein